MKHTNLHRLPMLLTGSALVLAGCGGAATSTSTTTATPPTPATTVQVYETTTDKTNLLSQQTSVTFGSTVGAGTYTITVIATTVLQPWDGVGAALTDSAATVIAALPAAQQTSVMQSLFSPSSGIGLNMVRLPMGASDLSASGNYSYDDVAAGQTDPTLTSFSIAHDKTAIIPLLQTAYGINSNIKIIASPWSPPAWMKTNGSMKGVTGAPMTTSQIYAADFPYLANYFVKFIQGYAASNLPVYAVSAQNEPLNTNSGYPTAILTATDEATFIGTYLGPAMATAGLSSTKIFGLEDNWADTAYATTLLQTSSAAQYLAGTSFHWYAGTVGAMSTIYALNTSKGVWFTEGTGTVTCTTTCPTLTGSSFSGTGFDFDMQQLIIGVPQNFGRAIVSWNIALNQNEGPQNGGCNDCVGVITVDSSTSPASIYYNNMYYALGHIGKFVTPGASVISTSSQSTTGIESVGFKNPDGTLVVVAYNGGTASTTFTLSWNSKTFDYTLPAGAAVSFKWSGT